MTKVCKHNTSINKSLYYYIYISMICYISKGIENENPIARCFLSSMILEFSIVHNY